MKLSVILILSLVIHFDASAQVSKPKSFEKSPSSTNEQDNESKDDNSDSKTKETPAEKTKTTTKDTPTPTTRVYGKACPYLSKDDESKAFLKSVSDEITSLQASLKEKDKDCTLDTTTISKSITQLSSAINTLKQNEFPAGRTMANLTVGSTPYLCPSNKSQFYTFISTYIQNRIDENYSSAVAAAAANATLTSSAPNSSTTPFTPASTGLSGALGSSVETAVSNCLGSNASSTIAVATGENNAIQCVYSTLSFSPTSASNNASPIDTAWNSCNGGGTGGQINSVVESYQQHQTNIQNKQAAFENGMDNLTSITSSLTTLISTGDGNKCKAIKGAVNSAIQTALGVAGSLAGPWGAVGATMIAPTVSTIINTIGSNAKTIKDLNALLASIGAQNAEDLQQSFSCNLFTANQLNCEYLNRSRLNPKCPTETKLLPEQNLSSILDLQNTLAKIAPDTANSTGNENFNKEGTSLSNHGAEALYHEMFDPTITLTNGKKVSKYDFLFMKKENGGANDGLFTVYDQAYQTALDQYNKGIDTPGITIDPSHTSAEKQMELLKSNLDRFKLSYREHSAGKKNDNDPFEGGKDALSIIQSTQFNTAVSGYLDYEIDEKSGKITDGSEPNGLDTALLSSLKTKFIQGAMNSVTPDVPSNPDKTTSLLGDLDNFYRGFLNDGSIIKTKYVMGELDSKLNNFYKDGIERSLKRPTVKNSDGTENLSDVGTMYDKYLYSALRDCLLNYQFAVEGADHKQLNDSYKKLCGFLNGCKGKNNTIGIPFETDGGQQGDPLATNMEQFKACGIVNNYDLITENFKKEVYQGKICGVKITDALKTMVAK